MGGDTSVCDADLAMAELSRAGDTIDRYARSRGCACQSLIRHTCTECGRTFGSEERWNAFLDAVGNGTFDEADALRPTASVRA